MTRPTVLRAVTWYGEMLGEHEFSGVPPKGYDRYLVKCVFR